MNNKLKIKFTKLTSNAVIPTKSHTTDAGFDLTATSKTEIEDDMYEYGTGIAVEIPTGHVGLLFPRSSVYKTGLLLTNCVGVIDSGYRGEVKAKFAPINHNRDKYEVGDRIAQLIIMPYPEIEFVEVSELEDSDRGTGGYGSTGR